LDYECVISGQPQYQGENTAVVTWPNGESSATVGVGFELDGETDKSVEVFDDKTDPEGEPVLLGSAEWNAEGTPTEFEYVLEL
ncbi:hypothetical protein, partial [Zhihengliuella halotolerans]